MRPFRTLIATWAAAAVLAHTTGAYAAGESPEQSVVPDAMVVLNDISAALSEARAAPLAVEPAAGFPDAAADALPDANLPESGSQPAEATSGLARLTLRVPGVGVDLAPRGSGTALFDGIGSDTTVAVQRAPGSLRALLHIDSARAPERFDFRVGGDVAALHLARDGGVMALDAGGDIVAFAPKPWAMDADGARVPTHYEINGTTLTQVVEHHSGQYSYGIVADPSFFFWVKCGAAVALFAAQNTSILGKVGKLGPILKDGRKFVDYLRKFRSIKGAAHHIAAVLGSASGVNDLVSRCWP